MPKTKGREFKKRSQAAKLGWQKRHDELDRLWAIQREAEIAELAIQREILKKESIRDARARAAMELAQITPPNKPYLHVDLVARLQWHVDPRSLRNVKLSALGNQHGS
jgi:hypothetical protein